MHEHVVSLPAPSGRMLYVWFEPWAEGVGFPPGTIVELHGASEFEGELEIVVTEERTAVYGWRGSKLRVLADGKEVRYFDLAAPDTPKGQSTREFVSFLFGAPPVPTAEERSPKLKKSWWRFWQ